MDNRRTVKREQLLLLLDQLQRGGSNPLFGECLRTWRKELGLEPSAFARHLNVSAQTVFRWERGFSLNAQQELRLREVIDELEGVKPAGRVYEGAPTQVEVRVALPINQPQQAVQDLTEFILSHPTLRLLGITLK